MDEFIQFMEKYLQVVNESLPEMTDEEAQVVLQFVDEAFKFIQSQQGAISPETPPIEAAPSKITPIPASEYESSNVNGFKYDPKSGKLMVQFHGPYPQAEGSVYEYSDVPEYIVDIFARGAIGPKTSGANRFHRWIKNVTPSLGGSLNALLKAGKFPYRKLVA